MSVFIKKALFGALACSLVAVAPGCRQKEDSKDEVVEKPAAAMSPTPSALFSWHIAMLPPKPIAVGYFDIARVLSPRLDDLYAPTNEPEQIDNLEKMRQEVSVIFLSNFGVDVSATNAALMVVTDHGFALVLDGVKLPGENEGKTLETEEIVGEAVYKFQDDNNARFPLLYMRELANESGVILYSSRELVEGTMSSGEGQAAEMGAFVEKWQGAGRPRAFFTADLRAKAFADLRSSIENEVGQLPDQVVVSIEERTLVKMVGSRSEMKGLADRIDAGYKVMTAALEKRNKDYYEMGGHPLVGASGTYASFLLLNYGMYLERYELSDEALTYSFPRLDDRYLPFWSSALASVAIPSFLRAVKKSKVSEVDRVMASLSQQIKDKIDSKYGAGGSCELPSGAGPSSPVPTNGSKVSPQFDDPGWKSYDTGSLGLSDGAYFSYRILRMPSDGDAEFVGGDTQPTMVIEATADFSEGGPMHTVEQSIYVGVDCEVSIVPLVIMNEFE